MAKAVSVGFVTKVVEIEVNDNETESLAAMAAINAAQRADEAKSVVVENLASTLSAIEEKGEEEKDVIDAYTDTKKTEIAAFAEEVVGPYATNAANSAQSARNTAAALTEYLETKETLTAPAVDSTLIISGAAADARETGYEFNQIKLFSEYTDILSGKTINVGYYYNQNGEQVSNANFASIENIPYNPEKKFIFLVKPVVIAFNSDDEIVHYFTADSNIYNCQLPLWGNVSYFHISFRKERMIRGYSAPWYTNNGWKKLTCVIYGDSIAYGNYASNQRVDHPFIELAVKMNGINTITNKAIGGAAYSSGGDAAYTIWHDEMVDNSNPHNEADLVIVSAGTNDWGHSSPLGELGDDTTDTFYGAVYLVLNSLKYKNHKAKVLVCLPLSRGSGDAMTIVQRENSLGLTMDDYRNAIIDVCNALNIEYVTANELYINPFYFPGLFSADKLHPLENGHVLMAAALAKRINQLAPKDMDILAR